MLQHAWLWHANRLFCGENATPADVLCVVEASRKWGQQLYVFMLFSVVHFKHGRSTTNLTAYLEGLSLKWGFEGPCPGLGGVLLKLGNGKQWSGNRIAS